MDKYSRVIFALFFLIAAVSGLIDSWTPSKVVPLVGARVQIHSLLGAPPTIPAIREKSSHVAGNLLPEASVRASKEKFPREFLEITDAGVVCDDHRLDLPKIDLKEILDEDRHLPRRSMTVFVPEKLLDGILYRNIALELRWEPATPEFLQIHLEEYLPYWENQIPYRLFWDARYEICPETCSSFSEAGEILPEDIDDLPPSLAADVNFNGVPAAFWNVNVTP